MIKPGDYNKYAFVVSSTMRVREDASFTYNPSRSFFSTDERIRQTIGTIHNLTTMYPLSAIYLVDSSQGLDRSIYDNLKLLFPKLIIHDVPDHVAAEVNTHKNKSYCESMLLNSFYAERKSELSEYNMIFKTTARYLYSNMSIYQPNAAFAFKTPLSFPWDDSWQYQMVDMRAEQQDNMLRQYCTVLYAFSPVYLTQMMNINETIMHVTNMPDTRHYDTETLMYFLTRPYQEQIVETDWKVTGWDGVSGRLMHY